MKVLVYVEGPADRAGLEALLRPLIEAGQERGVGMRFLPQHGKGALLEGVPSRAADHLADHPNDWVIALPDLYPMRAYDGTANEHRSGGDLDRLLRRRFEARADLLRLGAEARRHFLVHCLKHDLEALLLACPGQLRRRLGTDHSLENRWRKPVEEQDDERPPKQIVERLFRRYRGKPGYVDTSDAPWILERADLPAVEKACPQCFAPFVADLRGVMNLSA